MEKADENPGQGWSDDRHGKPPVTVVARGAGCSLSAGDAHLHLLPGEQPKPGQGLTAELQLPCSFSACLPFGLSWLCTEALSY